MRNCIAIRETSSTKYKLFLIHEYLVLLALLYVINTLFIVKMMNICDCITCITLTEHPLFIVQNLENYAVLITLILQLM
jgi:hypothetical protein